jgi:hypothetical protein
MRHAKLHDIDKHRNKKFALSTISALRDKLAACRAPAPLIGYGLLR